MNALASTSNHLGETFEAAAAAAAANGDGVTIDASLTVRDSSAKAFMRELRKVIERSDVIIQVLDARDPEGTRSKWVEEEVRKRDAQGKKLLAVVNKIDLVPRENLEAWLRHLRHSFPCMPFKSSTQNQRQNLSQNAVPLVQAPTVPGQKAVYRELPSTSSSLGAPALLDLLKQYALSTPHNALTVGVVGYPNVGKSSLINSLKRSRACGVAAMPGKTRVVQEVLLDKGVKILDCPGVVLEDIGREFAGPEGRRRQAEIMLRNCIKPELVEDPTAPVEVIIDRADQSLLMNLYNIPPFSDLRDFLIKVALTRGRLGKGGVPDLEGAAVQVLRDWNSGKIPYTTKPPAVHASSMPDPAVVKGADGDDDAMSGDQVGDAKLLTKLSEAFTIDGLFDNLGDEAAWEGEDAAFQADEMEEDADLPPAPVAPVPAAPVAAPTRPVSHYVPPLSPGSDMSSRRSARDSLSPEPHSRPLPSFPGAAFNPASVSAFMPVPARPTADPTKLFMPEELALLPPTLDRQKQKAQAKKAKKRRAAAERTEGELLLGFMGMDVDEEMYNEPPPRPSGKKARQEKKAAAAAAKRAAAPTMQVDTEAQKEADFAKFLSNMGGEFCLLLSKLTCSRRLGRGAVDARETSRAYVMLRLRCHVQIGMECHLWMHHWDKCE